MRFILPYFLSLLPVMTLLSCVPEASAPAAGQCLVSLTIGTEALTKSVLPGDIESRLDNACVFIRGAGGYYRYHYFDLTAQAAPSAIEWRMPSGENYTVYAVGNMGDILGSIPPGADGPNLEALRFQLPSYSSLTGMPMALKTTLSAAQMADGASVSLPLELERLMARVTVCVNKSGITGGDAARALQSASLHMRQVARALYPFMDGGSRALSDADIFAGDTDYYEFTPSDEWDLNSGTFTFYVPENMQGILLPSGASQEEKTGTNSAIEALPQKGWLSYIEFRGSKSGAADGVSGGLTYRGYLGENVTNSFSVQRNKSYNATLSLSWDGFTWHADGWRIETGSNWNDSRTLGFLDADGHPLPYLKIHKKGSGDAYAYFSIGADAGIGTAGRKDVASYPYGWHLTGNGRTLSGADGSTGSYTVAPGVTVQCLGTESVGGKLATHLRFAASASAETTTENASLRHVFGLCTMDGKVTGTGLELDIEDLPFEGSWEQQLSPDHLAQKGLLCCKDPYTGEVSTEGVFHVTDPSKIRLTDNGDGTAWVSVIAPFGAGAEGVFITDADGDRRVDIPLEGRVPHFDCSSLTTSYADAATSVRFSYYACKADGSAAGELLKVSASPSLIHCGEYLDKELVEELIAPSGANVGQDSYGTEVGFSPVLRHDGSYDIYTYISRYPSIGAGQSAKLGGNKSWKVRDVKYYMAGFDSSFRMPKSDAYWAWNPWWLMDSVTESNNVMNDYTLYKEPNGWMATGEVGWQDSPSYAPVETGSYGIDVKNAVVANLGNLNFNAYFSDGGGYLGSRVFSGTPDRVSWDYSPGTNYSLYMTINSPSDYDWETVGNYLYYNQGHWISTIWSAPTSTDAIRKQLVDEALENEGWDVQINAAYPTAARAWEDAPEGISAANPGAIRGVSFSVRSKSIYSTWRLSYSMAGLSEEDIDTHGAGKALVKLRVTNPFNSASPALEHNVVQVYIRLHLWIWPAAVGPEACEAPGSGNGYRYGAYPYLYTNGKPVKGLDQFGFFGKHIVQPADATYTNAGTTYYVDSSPDEGAVTREISDRHGVCYWQFPTTGIFDGLSAPEQHTKLRTQVLSGLSSINASPFTFKSTPVLVSELGANLTYFSRVNSGTLYYDPSGAAKTYSAGNNPADKLFYIKMGCDNLNIGTAYYYHSSNGF